MRLSSVDANGEHDPRTIRAIEGTRGGYRARDQIRLETTASLGVSTRVSISFFVLVLASTAQN